MNRVEEAVANLQTYRILWDNLQNEYKGKKKGESYCYRRDQIKRKLLNGLEKLKAVVTSVPMWHIRYGENQELITAGQTEQELRTILEMLGIRDYVITQIKRENIRI